MSRHRTPPPDRTQTLANVIGDIVTDIRQKVVEEPWYGRDTSVKPTGYPDLGYGRGPIVTNFYGPATFHGATTIYGPRDAKPKEPEKAEKADLRAPSEEPQRGDAWLTPEKARGSEVARPNAPERSEPEIEW